MMNINNDNDATDGQNGRDCLYRVRAGRGFTLMEMLIVVAIIAVLVAISIPVFSGQMEKSRESVDLANVRSAYAEVMAAAMTEDGAAAHGGTAIKKSDDCYQIVLSPIAQAQDGWQASVAEMSIGSVPSSEWIGSPRSGGTCAVSYYPSSGKATISWSSVYAGQSLTQLHAIPNAERVAEDQKTLTALGKAILEAAPAGGWTKDSLYNDLGILQTGRKSAIRIADYYQLKNGSSFSGEYSSAGFKLTANTSGKLASLLTSIGYDGGASTTSVTADSQLTNAGDTTYANSLFYSDQLATNQYGNYDISATKRSIIIDTIKTDSSGKITSFNIYTKAMDGNANMGDDDKALFNINIK